MTKDEAVDALIQCQSLRESTSLLEWKAFMRIVCDRPKPELRVVGRVDRDYWLTSEL